MSNELETTAIHALKYINKIDDAKKWEYGGIIVLYKGQYQYSMFPVTNKNVAAVTVDVTRLLLPGATLKGLYHTHPCSNDYYSQYFSQQDLVSPYYFGVPTFILDECTGDVHEFDPKIDKVHDTGRDIRVITIEGISQWIHLPSGRIIGNIFRHRPSD